MDEMVKVTWSKGSNPCCHKFSWRGTFILKDNLGFDPGDLLYVTAKIGLYPNRPVIQARFEFKGSGECCED